MRLFSEHFLRRVDSLDGAWQFLIDPTDIGEKNKWYNGLPDPKTVVVPSVWNTQLDLMNYEGAAWYSRKFFTVGGTLRFCFGAVMTEATVWLDGERLGCHYGGFCEFDFIARGISAGEHTLTVRVDNRFDAHSIPQPIVDWYHYGGITRSVTVEVLSGVTVLSNRMEYDLADDMTAANARFVLEVYNASDEICKSTINIAVANVTFATYTELGVGELREISTDYRKIEKIDLWSPESPKLYDVKISTETDDLFDRVGFRLVTVSDGQIKLNGRPIELRGVNRHEEHPEFGMAFPPALMARDIDIIADMGSNTIRGSHYPNNPVFVDMLDERGMLFWSEIPIWGGGFSTEALADPIVLERGEMMHREMVKHYYNHPSIIIWGMHNEIKTYLPEGYEMSRRYYNLLKDIGGNRIVTYATNRALTDICYEFCDVISINQYNGWYGDEGIESWDSFLDKVREYRRELGFENKPVIMSEFGGGAVYGHRNFDSTVRWSESYQERLIAYTLDLFHRDPMIVGSLIWQFTDIRTCREMGVDRARGYNNKGILNEHRNPKAAYFAARELFGKFAEETK